MARPRSESREALVSSAMRVFWKKGYAATSIEDLVAATGVGRGGIYADFGGKDALYLSCLDAYRETFVDPALERLASGADGFSGIEAYFDHFIALHARHGMPGPGCFVASAMTELAQDHPAVLAIVDDHMAKLRTHFLDALCRARQSTTSRISDRELEDLSGFLATATQGLWSFGKTVDELQELDAFKRVILDLLKSKFSLLADRPD